MTSTYIDLPTFDIRHFEDRLTLTEGHKDRYLCPGCNGNNLTFSRTTGAYTCWNDESDKHRTEIKEAICPFNEALEAARGKQGGSIQSATKSRAFKPRTKAVRKSAPLPASGITLAKLAAPATDAPQPYSRSHYEHGEVQVWEFRYSDRQWIERIQWADPQKKKGYDKDYFPFYLADGGEEVPIRKGRKIVGHRIAAANEKVCGSGAAEWKFYREAEAIEAAIANGANAVLLLEGEPCVEFSRSLGIAAITMPGNKWTQQAIAAMAGRLRAVGLAIVMIPDHDKTGYDKAGKVAAGSAAAGVPYLQLDPVALDPEIQEHGDVVDSVAKIGFEAYRSRLEAEIYRQVELRRELDGGNSDPPANGGGGGGDDGDEGSSGDDTHDNGNPDNPFKEDCERLRLPFKYCVTRQQFDGSAYRVLFGGEEGNWMVINSAFYRWNGKHWAAATDTQIQKILSDYGEKAFKISFDQAQNPYVTRPYENNKHKESAFKYCRSRLERDNLPSNSHLLAFNDRVVDLRTGATMPHNKQFFLTNLTPYDYQPNSECPEVFRKFIADSFGEDLLEVIRAFTSMFLDPTAPYGRFPYLIGQSGGGKGTLGRFWSSLFGEQGAGGSNNFSDLSTPEGRHQYLTGKRIFGFPDVGGFAQGLRAFYELVDNGAMTGRALFNPVAYSKTWYVRFWVAAVNFLQIENAGDGWARRAYPLTVLSRTVAPDPDLGRKLEAVKAQVISWALSMPRAERDAILLTPPTNERVKNATLDAALYGDSARSFIDLCLRPSSEVTATVSHSQLHSWYVAYCREHGYIPLGQTKFIAHLKTVLPRHYAERSWSQQVDGDRERIPAHWKFVAPLLGVFVSSGGNPGENPQWVCLKAKCLEGGLEGFEKFWNPLSPEPQPDDSSKILAPDNANTLKPLLNVGVQAVHLSNVAEKGVDTLKPLPSVGVHSGSTVQSENPRTENRMNLETLQKNGDADFLEVQTPLGQTGQAGQSHVERISANPPCLDTAGHPGQLNSEQLSWSLKAMAAVECIRTFEQFYLKYQQLPDAQQRQIWETADPELRQNYQHWLDEFSAVPEAVWEARTALLRVTDAEEMKAARQQFDRDALIQASSLTDKKTRKELRQLVKAADRLQ